MSIAINGMSQRNKFFAELGDTLVVTSGADRPRYVALNSLESGFLGFDVLTSHWDRPSGVENGSGTLADAKHFCIVVVPVNTRIVNSGEFKRGMPGPASQPVLTTGALAAIDWTIPPHEQEYIKVCGSHTSATASTTVLTDSTLALATDALVGYELYNLTKNVSETITANTATTITTSALPGSEEWEEGDEYQVRGVEADKLYVYS
jgi:hypothetical protein